MTLDDDSIRSFLIDPVPLSAGREFHKIVARFYRSSEKVDKHHSYHYISANC
jgi:hypothetical protein